MFTLHVDLTGFPEIGQKFTGLLQATDEKAILDESGALLLNRLRTRYLAEKAPDGQKWLPSKAAQRRAASGRGGGTLYDTGRLYQSIQLYQIEQMGGGYGRRIGTDVPYGRFVNYGTNRLPPRVFMGFAPEDINLAVKLIVNRITKALA